MAAIRNRGSWRSRSAWSPLMASIALSKGLPCCGKSTSLRHVDPMQGELVLWDSTSGALAPALAIPDIASSPPVRSSRQWRSCPLERGQTVLDPVS